MMMKNKIRAIFLSLSILSILSGCSSWQSIQKTDDNKQAKSAQMRAKAAAQSGDLAPVKIIANQSGLAKDWYKKAVFSEIYVRGYKDSDGDGIGDLKGLTQKLDYLKDLGIGGIWLMPISASADHDHGYAVTNYRSIEPDYGTLEDFKIFLAEAHKRGIGVIVDYVMNHSSDLHPLFQDSRQSQSVHRDWYVWSQGHPKNWKIWGSDPWHQDKQGSYYGIFWSGMPDFNLRNEEVVSFHKNNLKFWLNLGVDGFRFDATGHLFENGPDGWDNQPENHLLLKDIRQLLNQYSNRYMICESPSTPTPYADSCGAVFAFGMQKPLFNSALQGKVQPELMQYINNKPVARMGTMLSNHDAFAGQRTFDQVSGDIQRYKLLAATYLTLPGTPFIYYGEEIGMAHGNEKSHDHALRTPMSWTAQGGFSEAAKAFRSAAVNHGSYNVADQQKDKLSLLNHYKKLIVLRSQYPALSIGTYQTVTGTKNNSQLAFIRNYKSQKVLVVLNYGKQKSVFKMPLKMSAQPLYSSAGSKLNKENTLLLPAQSFAIYLL